VLVEKGFGLFSVIEPFPGQALSVIGSKR
jgi:hypothetical protein